MKLAIRELEQVLVREREFNSENNRMNIEYLVNILRRFLTCTNASERASLARAVCQVLHFRQDETKHIVSLWQSKGGLLGFLTAPRQVLSGSGPSSGGAVVDTGLAERI